MALTYAIVFVSDMSRSVRFYRDVLGLDLKLETSHWTEFATGAATLALHLAETRGVGRASSELPAGSCRPGLTVPDLTAFHARMLENGVPCLQAPKETFGVRIAQYADPDGLTLSISEERPPQVG